MTTVVVDDRNKSDSGTGDSLRSSVAGPGAAVAAPANVGPTRETVRIPELDGVRGLAIALVLAYHYLRVSVPDKTALYYALQPVRLMWSGVDLFFVLSGLLIGGILLDHRTSFRYYAVFYQRRIHRIFPVYYLMIALLAIGASFFPKSPLFVGTMPLWAFPLFAQNLLGDFTRAPVWLTVSWSLAVEEQFYLLFPAIVRVLSNTALLLLMGICIVGAPVLRAALIKEGWGFEQLHPLLLCRADALALGVVAAVLVRNESAKTWIKSKATYLYLCLLSLLAFLPVTLDWNYRYMGSVGYSLFGVTYFTLILMLMVSPLPLLRSVFRAGWLRWLGGVSYCVYLIHEPVRVGVSQLLQLGNGTQTNITDLRSFLVIAAALGLTLGLAQLSWVDLEKPLINRAHVRYRYQ